ncbi:DJ-1/PfpI family protein [Streptomyces sp. NPDC050560]|uniref:DJ-1/PfpI family protein n=1 Tax=Streptomyces sp. NPDC050560 TaxID=3365630 RepID=UPI0037B6B02F
MRVVIPVFDGFTALDAVGPYELLRMVPGAEVVWAAERRGPVADHARGLELVAEAAFDEVDAADVLVVPGGPGARSRTGDERLTGWLRRVHGTTTWTTSVCTGSLLLGAAGLLEGLTATTHWSAVPDLEAFGASYTAERVVVHEDERIITSAGVSSGIDMAMVLSDRLAGPVVAQTVQLFVEYDPQPPFDSGSWAKAPEEVRERARSFR